MINRILKFIILKSIVTYEREGYFLVAIFEKSFRPRFHYKFQKEESRDNFIKEAKVIEDKAKEQINIIK